MAAPLSSIERLPEVKPSSGVRAVSPEIMTMLRRLHAELFRRDLRQRGEDALAELDLAGEDGGGAVGIDAQPGIEHAVARKAAGQRARAARRAGARARLKAMTMPPAAAAPNWRRVSRVMSRPSRHVARGAQYRADDARMRAAAAEIAGERLAHVMLARRRIAPEQIHRAP